MFWIWGRLHGRLGSPRAFDHRAGNMVLVPYVDILLASLSFPLVNKKLPIKSGARRSSGLGQEHLCEPDSPPLPLPPLLPPSQRRSTLHPPPSPLHCPSPLSFPPHTPCAPPIRVRSPLVHCFAPNTARCCTIPCGTAEDWDDHETYISKLKPPCVVIEVLGSPPDAENAETQDLKVATARLANLGYSCRVAASVTPRNASS